jgi:hypothetical protein
LTHGAVDILQSNLGGKIFNRHRSRCHVFTRASRKILRLGRGGCG